jgi:hypothetical protein
MLISRPPIKVGESTQPRASDDAARHGGDDLRFVQGATLATGVAAVNATTFTEATTASSAGMASVLVGTLGGRQRG